MAKNKINWLLILQGWAMLWVVIGHSPLGEPGTGPEWENVLYHFAYSFHMPLFMLVSGWLFYLPRLNTNKSIWGGQKWTYPQIVKDKALRLLLPGFVFSLVAFALKIAFPGEMTRQVGLNPNDIIHAYLYPYDNPMRELWFIAVLFWLMLLTPIWKLLLQDIKIMCGMIIVLMVLHLYHPTIDLLCFGGIFKHAIWFYLGLVISKTELVDKLLNKNAWLTLLTGVVIFFIGMYTDAFIKTVGGITLSFGVALLLDKHLPKAFFSFRNYTYQIFLMGIFVQIAVKIAYRNIEMPYMLAFVLCIVVGLYVPVLISKIIEKINWKPLKLCVGLK